MPYLKLTFILLILAITGCAQLSKEFVSRADTKNTSELNRYGAIDNTKVRLQVRPLNKLKVASGVMLTLPFPPLFFLDKYEANNYTHISSHYAYTTSTLPSRFVIELLVSPKDTSIKIDFTKIALSIGSEKHYPSKVQGPYDIIFGKLFGFRVKRKDYDQLCKVESNMAPPTTPTGTIIPPDMRQCFTLTYSTTPPSPENNFSIDIESIFSGESKLEIPEINFHLHSYHNLGS